MNGFDEKYGSGASDELVHERPRRKGLVPESKISTEEMDVGVHEDEVEKLADEVENLADEVG